MPSTSSPPPRLRKDLLSAWLLLLIHQQPRHGYDIRAQLRARGYDAEPSGLYRVLREMEDEGLIVSRWAEGASGPQRRVYELMPKGREELHESASALARARSAQTAFLTSYKAAKVAQGLHPR